MGKLDFCLAKIKAQTSFAKLISAFVFATWIAQLIFFLNPKSQAFPAIFYNCTDRLVSDLIRNPKGLFSHMAAQRLSIISRIRTEASMHILASPELMEDKL